MNHIYSFLNNDAAVGTIINCPSVVLIKQGKQMLYIPEVGDIQTMELIYNEDKTGVTWIKNSLETVNLPGYEIDKTSFIVGENGKYYERYVKYDNSEKTYYVLFESNMNEPDTDGAFSCSCAPNYEESNEYYTVFDYVISCEHCTYLKNSVLYVEVSLADEKGNKVFLPVPVVFYDPEYKINSLNEIELFQKNSELYGNFPCMKDGKYLITSECLENIDYNQYSFNFFYNSKEDDTCDLYFAQKIRVPNMVKNNTVDIIDEKPGNELQYTWVIIDTTVGPNKTVYYNYQKEYILPNGNTLRTEEIKEEIFTESVDLSDYTLIPDDYIKSTDDVYYEKYAKSNTSFVPFDINNFVILISSESTGRHQVPFTVIEKTSEYYIVEPHINVEDCMEILEKTTEEGDTVVMRRLDSSLEFYFTDVSTEYDVHFTISALNPIFEGDLYVSGDMYYTTEIHGYHICLPDLYDSQVFPVLDMTIKLYMSTAENYSFYPGNELETSEKLNAGKYKITSDKVLSYAYDTTITLPNGFTKTVNDTYKEVDIDSIDTTNYVVRPYYYMIAEDKTLFEMLMEYGTQSLDVIGHIANNLLCEKLKLYAEKISEDDDYTYLKYTITPESYYIVESKEDGGNVKYVYDSKIRVYDRTNAYFQGTDLLLKFKSDDIIKRTFDYKEDEDLNTYAFISFDISFDSGKYQYTDSNGFDIIEGNISYSSGQAVAYIELYLDEPVEASFIIGVPNKLTTFNTNAIAIPGDEREYTLGSKQLISYDPETKIGQYSVTKIYSSYITGPTFIQQEYIDYVIVYTDYKDNKTYIPTGTTIMDEGSVLLGHIVSISIPEGVTHMSQRSVFYDMRYYDLNVYLPSTLTFIEDDALALYSYNLKLNIFYNGTLADWDNIEKTSDMKILSNDVYYGEDGSVCPVEGYGPVTLICTDGERIIYNGSDAKIVEYVTTDGEVITTTTYTNEFYTMKHMFTYDNIDQIVAKKILEIIIPEGIIALDRNCISSAEPLYIKDMYNNEVVIYENDKLYTNGSLIIKIPSTVEFIDQLFEMIESPDGVVTVDIFYNGTKQQWESIYMFDGLADPLFRGTITIHCTDNTFEYCNPGKDDSGPNDGSSDSDYDPDKEEPGEIDPGSEEPGSEESGFEDLTDNKIWYKTNNSEIINPWNMSPVTNVYDSEGVMVFNDNVLSVASSAFDSCENLTEFYGGMSLATVGNYAFAYCRNLTSVNLPACTSVGIGAFSVCTSLTSVNLTKCTSIDNYAFECCTSLTNIDLPVCTTVGEGAFSQCSSLTSVNLPACTSVDNYTFALCECLSNVNLPACEAVYECAFSGCTSLTNIDLPACTRFRSYAFRECKNLTTVTLGASIMCSLDYSNVFVGCTKLTSICVPMSLVDTYKANSIWSWYTDKIVPITE